MEAILVKVFATALALSQVATRPDTIKTSFDPVQDRAEVVQLLTNGCAHMRKAFDVEQLDLDGLIETAMTDTRGGNEEIKAFRGLKFEDLFLAYRQFCKKEKIDREVVDIAQVIEFYNVAAAGLPDHNKLKALSMPGLTNVHDLKGAPYAELYEPNHRRLWVKLADVPEHVQQAFIAAEDKRFFKHTGIDERSVIRAFIGNVADPNSRQGGSTITQQVAKNLLVGNEVSYERKIREMIVAARVEKVLSKQEILEIYLNAIFLGRSSWGIELAARSYFGKSVKDLTLPEGAFLAGLAKGPSYYNPDRQRVRAQERMAYVLGRMQEDGIITDAQLKDAMALRLHIATLSRQRRDNGYYIVDQLGREAKQVAGMERLTDKSYVVRSTIHPQLQQATEKALQDGLARYEQSAGRTMFRAAEANLGEAIRKLQANKNTDRSKPLWQQALIEFRPPLYDVQWAPAVVVEKVNLKGGHEFDPCRATRWPRAAALDLFEQREAAAVDQRRDFRQRQREPGPRNTQRPGPGRHPRRHAHPPDRPRRRRGAGEPHRAHPRHGRWILLPGKPTQSRHPVAPPARLLLQAGGLSRRACLRHTA